MNWQAMDVSKSALLLAVYVAVAGCFPLRSSNRSLHVRSFPAVEGVSSNVYEVLMKPYTFDIHPLTAAVQLNNGEKGALFFRQRYPPVGPVLVTGNLTGLSPGKHAIYIHQWGDLRDRCEAAGPQFDPYQAVHTSRVGDLGNVLAERDGEVQVVVRKEQISLAGPRGIVGRAVSVHAGPEDASPVVACGIVGYIQHPLPGISNDRTPR
ncbi:uncharacterized protein [Anabrus simplex]|uniref:uncharacterized protein n=1 Tax=Anabrus simplex TaxID=316456 RepID=UPI0035A2B265